MTLGSLFDGIGGWLLAASRNGIEPLWSAEIEKFPCAVTAHHFRNVRQLGDVKKIDGGKIPAVDIICAGSPCQNLSIAGKREGLNGEQSSLFFRAVDIVRQMRRTSGKPKYFVWENVVGALNSNGGLDFKAVLEEITETEIPMPKSGRWAGAGMVRGGKCEIAWRILDAQYFGVPQRRRRIFLIADFTGRSTAKILFECESVSRNFAQSRDEKQGNSYGVKNRTKITSGTDKSIVLTRIASTLRAEAGAPKHISDILGRLVCSIPERNLTFFENHGQDSRLKFCEKISPTVTARFGTGGNNTPLVSYGIGRDAFNQGGNEQFGLSIVEELQPPLTAKGAGGCFDKKIVRRLTPLECERLQGLPENWTLIDSKLCSDSARYKAIGNGMAQPCADWIMKRIVEELKK